MTDLNFTSLFIDLIISFLIVFSTGSLITHILKLKTTYNSFNFFLNILFGIISIVTIYSIIITKGNSINLLTFFILLSVFIFNRKKIVNISILNINKYYVVLAVIILSSTFLILKYFIQYKTKFAVYGDNHTYSLIAHNLNLFGIETLDFDWTIPKHTNPYHYTEQWFTAFFSNLFSINTLHTYYFIYSPIFIVLIFFGAFSLYEMINVKNNKRNYILIGIICSTLFLFIQIVDNPFNSKIILNNFFYIGYPLFNIKYLIIYACLIASIIFIRIKNYPIAFLIILLLVPLYSTIIPALLTGLFCLFLYLYIIKKINIKTTFLYLLFIVLITILYLIFYAIQIKDAQEPWNKEMWDQFYDSIKKISKLLIALLLGLSIFLVFYFNFINKIKNKYKNQLSFYFNNYTLINSTFVLVVSGSLIVFIIFPIINTITHDSFQLLSNFIIPIYTISVYIILLLNIKRKNNIFKYGFLGILLVYFLLLSYKNPPNGLNMNSKHPRIEFLIDEEYYLHIKNIIKKDKNPRFAYFRNYKKNDAFHLKTYLYMPDNRIVNFQNNYMPLCLNPDEMPSAIDYRFGNKKEHAFYKYYLNEKNKNTKEVITLNFLKKHHIHYIILENNYLCPNYLKPFIIEKIKNKYNKNTFLKIKINDTIQ